MTLPASETTPLRPANRANCPGAGARAPSAHVQRRCHRKLGDGGRHGHGRARATGIPETTSTWSTASWHASPIAPTARIRQSPRRPIGMVERGQGYASARAENRAHLEEPVPLRRAQRGLPSPLDGKSTRNVVPTPGADSDVDTRPPQVCTRCQTVARPRPVPRPTSLVVKNGSKMRSSTSRGIPTPVSPTTMRWAAGRGRPSIRRARPTATASPGRHRPLQLVVQRIARIQEQVEHDLVDVRRVLHEGRQLRRHVHARFTRRTVGRSRSTLATTTSTSRTSTGSCSPLRPNVSNRLVSVAARSAAPAITSSSRRSSGSALALFAQHLDFQHDGREQIVELVGDAAHHFTDRAQPAALRQFGVHRAKLARLLRPPARSAAAGAATPTRRPRRR